MRNFLLLLAVIILGFSTTAHSQTDIPIGTGVTGNGGTGYPAPLQDWYEGSRAQYLYRASELITAGMSPGVITAIKFNVVNLNTFSGDIQEMQIKIGGTTATTLTDNWENVSTIYGPVNYTAVSGINTFTLSTPFFWNGSDNIVIEVCNGLPANVSDGIQHYTNNVTVPWTTGLSFNGSHTYRLDNAGNLCGQGDIADNALGVQTTRPNIIFRWTSAAACGGTPVGGTANSTITNILCPGANFTLSVSGQTLASGLSYQWQSSPDNTNWTNIAGATSMNHTLNQAAPIMYYRVVVTCNNAGGGSANSNPVTVTNGSGPTYAPLPFTESFENTWMNTCNTREIPNNSWRNTPGTGNSSWRRNDDGAAAAWTTPATGAYTPAASAGTYSARFHTTSAAAASTGRFDLHLNCNTAAANKRLQFDFINTNGADSVAIHVSTDGGANYFRVDSVKNSTTWRKKSVVFSSNSATTIVRFIAYSDAGSTDIGIDNLKVQDFDNCTGMPVGGTASSNAPPSVCAGVPFTLTVTGQTDAALLTYQWEISTDGGANWSPIAGATSETFTTTQVVTSLYRLKITCNGGLSANSTFTTVTSPAIPNGVYTINKNIPSTWPGPPGSNFTSFNAAYAAMSCGIGGPVTFNVVAGSGPYTEQLIMNPIINANATNTVTFNGNGETITFPTTNAERAVIKLKGADYIRLENLVINAPATTNAYGVELYNNADSNIIRNCTINLHATAVANSLAGIVMSGSETDPIGVGTTTALIDANQILNNTINGGYYGITLTATFAGGANGNNLIKGNTIKDFYQYGIYVTASYNTIIDSNRINRPARTNSAATVEGIYFTGQSNTALISRNRITNPFGGFASTVIPFNGITFNTASPSAGNDDIVVNNLIADITKTTGAINALNNNNSSSISFFHNTISLDDLLASTNASRGLNVAGTPSGVLFYDNMMSITRAGTGQKHGIYLGGGGLLLGSDYNNVYVAGTNAYFGFYTANRATLAAWKTATAVASLDVNSYSINPVFNNPATGDYCSANAAIDNKGLYIGVDNDINGNTRDLSTPDIGAFECTPPPCSIPPVTGLTVVTPTTICEGLPVVVDLTIGAFGSGQTFTWQGSTDGGANYTDLTGPLQTPGTNITATVTMLIRAKVSCSSASEYTSPVLLTVNPAFKAGSYTIDTTAAYTYIPGGTPGTNFKSFNRAYKEMATCGILGAVTFNVVPATGPYVEKLKMDSIRGTSAVNTITFNGNGEKITFDPLLPPTNTERAVIKLARADHIIFDSLVIDASNGVSFGYGVQLFNNADSNTFRRCRIIASSTGASNVYNGIVINSIENNATSLGNTLCDGNVFEKNTITGGFYGATVVGSAAIPIVGNKFLSNQFEDFYSTGIYVAGTENTILDSNTITRPNRLAGAAITGIFSTQAANNGLVISRNSIRNLAGANTAAGSPFASQQYAIYHNVDQVTPSYVYNNLISDLGGIGLIYALYNLGADNVHYYHNTVSLDSTAVVALQATRGYFQQGSALGIEFKNNIITIKRGGNALKHAIYIDNTTSTIIANYNDYYVSGSNAHIGFYPTTNRTTLAQWQAALTGQELNSLNIDPLYQNPAIQDYRPSIFTVDNLGTNATSVTVATDIKGIFRNVPPDMGAFEFVPVPCTTPPVPGLASVTPSSNICLQDPITLDITGHSSLGTLTFQWESSPDGVNWTTISPILYGPQFNTLTSPNTYYRARVACGSTGLYTNTVQVTLNNVVLAGTYTINKNFPTSWPGAPPRNFNSFQDAVNAMQCGITGPVVFNVNPDTYTEQIRINNIRNTSAVNTVIFQSATGVASDVNLTYASTSAGLNYTLKLDSTQYFTFRNMTISATNTSFGRAVEIANTASYDNIVNCNIVAPTVLANNSAIAGIYANPVKGTNLVIKKNTITNGSNGIYFAGTSIASLALPGHLIDSNTVSGTSHTAIFVQNTNDIVISNNTVNLSGPLVANAAGINTNHADSGYRIQGNTVNINNSAAITYGIYVQNSISAIADSGIIRSNRVVANTGNTSTIYGMTVTGSQNLYIVNNTVGINSAGATTYGLHSLSNSGKVNWFNNSSQINTNSASGYAAYFSHTTTTGTRVFNNIFANKGTGRALYVNIPTNFQADYNMLYSGGVNLVQTTGVITNFTTLLQWKNTWNWDRNSIVARPAFVSNTDIRPDVTNDSSWLMQGRGVQIPGNAYDFNGAYRAQTLTEGVPDLGAYEFYPSVAPTLLKAFPASPAPNTEQKFVYGTDTVMKIKWGATAPPSVDVRRYSGVVPPGLQLPPNSPRPDSMFFHTTVDVPGSNYYPYSATLGFVESWMGSIPEEYQIGMGRKLENLQWVVGFNSKTDVAKNEISQQSMNYFDVFTGLLNPFAQKEQEDSISNRGKDFWVGYQRSNAFTDGGVYEMVLYLGAGAQQANVKVEIEGTTGTPWVRNYVVPPNSAIQSDNMPKTGADDARLIASGLYAKKGIHITSDAPIVAYAHEYTNSNSGATMLMPTPVWGYEYYALTSRQNYSGASYSAFHFVAKDDNTWVEVNPSNPTLSGWVHNGGTQPNGSYLVQLNKGDAFQVLGAIQSGSEGYDLTGSYIKSIANNLGECHPIAVFAGSTRTGIGCGGSPGSSGDVILQQVFPYQAWGTKYATAPTHNDAGPNSGSEMTNIYRVMVKDPATVVKRNGGVLSGIINNRYYQFESNTPDYIESDLPVLVAQFMSSTGLCPNTAGDGDPEMFYLSPLQQAIKSSQFYRNELDGINVNYLTLVLPTEGLNTLRLDGVNWLTYPSTEIYVRTHPNLAGYSIFNRRYPAGAGSGFIESELPFTGIVYGLGSVESYGYNFGTLVKNLNNLSSVNNQFNTSATPTEYTCKGAPFNLTVLLPMPADSIRWRFSELPQISPNVDSIQKFPAYAYTTIIDGIKYYAYTINQSFTINAVGVFTIPLTYWSPQLESCDKSQIARIGVQVFPAPEASYTVAFSGGNPQACEGDIATFTGDLVATDGSAVIQWDWTFHNGSTPTGQVQTMAYPTPGTYNVKLKTRMADGCFSDTTRPVVINPKPVVVASPASQNICPGDNATFSISAPVAGTTYNWYNVPTGGTILGTGTSFTATGVTPPATFYAEGVSAAGCVSVTRAQVTVSTLPQLSQPVVTVTGFTANSVTFGWTAIAGASGYEVSTNNGTSWSTPSSGATGTSHTVSGLGTLTQSCLLVRVLGTLTCQTNTSASVCGCTNSSAVVITPVVSVCTGTSASFTIQSPQVGVTYKWYSAATGGTLLGTGTTFNSPAVLGSTNYYVEQASATCTGSPRTQVTANILPPLTPPVVDSSMTVNSITWTWLAVPGAASYQVSLDNGATWITPSSGATGLSHTISGLPPVTLRCLIVRAVGTIACQTSQSGSVCARTRPDAVFIPNTFTPNGDGKNDALMVYGWGIQSIQFMVFNQWGEKIHETTTTAQNSSTGGFIVWDGKYKGTVQPIGVYVYTAKITLKDGAVVEKSGPLNIVR